MSELPLVESVCPKLTAIRAGAKVAKEHAQRYADEYEAAESANNRQYWLGCVAGIDTLATVVETVFSMADEHQKP